MSGGFWAGAVPPWAFVALVGLVILVIGGITLGAWYGYGRGFAHAEEERQWQDEQFELAQQHFEQLEREQAKARRTRSAYRQPGERTRIVLDYRPNPIPGLGTPIWSRTEEDQAIAIANEPAHNHWPLDSEPLVPCRACSPITTGEIQAITDRVDEWMATWIGQEAGRG